MTLTAGLGCPTSGPATRAPSDATPAVSILRVGTSGDYAPFSVPRRSTDADGPALAGFSVDVAAAYAAETGRRLELVPFRWPALGEDLATGRFDVAISGVTVRPDRSTTGRFSHPLTVSGAVALVERDDPGRGRADLDRPDRVIAVNAGGHLERTARALFPLARIEAIPDNEAVLDRLGRDGVSVVLTDSLEAPHWQARRAGLRAIGPLTRDRKAAWFPRGGEAEAARFDAWLLASEREGRLTELRARAGLPTTKTAETTAALLARIDERLSLMEGVAQSKWRRGVPVEDRAREARVLDAAVAAVAKAALARGLEPPAAPAVRRLYGAQIDAAKAIQRRWIGDRPRAAAPDAATLERARATLDEEIRPALLFLGDRIAELVVLLAAEADSRAPDERVLAEALARHALPEPILTDLAEALAAMAPQ